jgi:hypothetical protein
MAMVENSHMAIMAREVPQESRILRLLHPKISKKQKFRPKFEQGGRQC